MDVVETDISFHIQTLCPSDSDSTAWKPINIVSVINKVGDDSFSTNDLSQRLYQS